MNPAGAKTEPFIEKGTAKEQPKPSQILVQVGGNPNGPTEDKWGTPRFLPEEGLVNPAELDERLQRLWDNNYRFAGSFMPYAGKQMTVWALKE